MRKGFTLMELMIVIIIIGILATMGIVQYTKAIERSRAAEGKQFIGSLRQMCAATYMEFSNTTDCDGTTWVGNYAPTTCDGKSYFQYSSSCTAGSSNCTFTATRCGSTVGTKVGGDSTQNISLKVDYSAGNDTWAYTQAYK